MAVVTVFGQRCAESLAHSPQHRASIEEEREPEERTRGESERERERERERDSGIVVVNSVINRRTTTKQNTTNYNKKLQYSVN